MDAKYAEQGRLFNTAPCDLHEDHYCDCHDGGGGDEQSLYAVTGGVPCVDSSAMNNYASGDGGRTYAACVCFCAERAFLKDDFVWVECTERWSAGTLRDRLPADFFVYRATMCGKDIGDSYNRPRCGVLALNDARMCLALHSESYMEYAGARPTFAVPDFWQTLPEDQGREIRERAKTRVVPVDQDFDWEDI